MIAWRHILGQRHMLSVATLLLSWAVPAAGQDPPRANEVPLPRFSELRPGWNLLRPGGETRCAKGGEYAFSVRPGARDKLLVFFQGGGGCHTAETCDRGQPFYLPAIDFENASKPRDEGIFDQANPENPFSEYSTVFVRYCTGDVHLGDRDEHYTLTTDKGESRRFEIHHRGQVNAMVVMRWIQANIAAPREIFVAGTSAGSTPTPFYASLLARHYSTARVVGLGDAQGHGNTSLPRPDSARWGLPDALRRHQGWEQFPVNWAPPDLYITAARREPRLQLFQVNHAYDAVTRSYMRLRMAADQRDQRIDMLALLRANHREIARHLQSFRYFTIGGRDHGALPDDRFYAYSSNGTRLSDWVTAIAAGKRVASVECRDCSRPEFSFGEQDLQIVERALALVSPPGAWTAGEPPQRCGPKLDRYSLECALLTAVNEITGRPPRFRHAGLWQVSYLAIDRLGPEFDEIDQQAERGVQAALPLRLYNNRAGTTAADVINLLEQARERIRTNLRQKAK